MSVGRIDDGADLCDRGYAVSARREGPGMTAVMSRSYWVER